MKAQTDSFFDKQLAKMTGQGGYLFRKPGRTIASLQSISRVISVFSLLFIAAYVYKLFQLSGGINHFKLLVTQIDILPLYQSNTWAFFALVIYDFMELFILAGTFHFFSKFLKSISIDDPFANVKSTKYIMYVAILSIAFFTVDVISTLHLNYFDNEVNNGQHIQLFHFEYLFLAYFVNVFAFIFKRGVDIKNEIDLVI